MVKATPTTHAEAGAATGVPPAAPLVAQTTLVLVSCSRHVLQNMSNTKLSLDCKPLSFGSAEAVVSECHAECKYWIQAVFPYQFSAEW